MTKEEYKSKLICIYDQYESDKIKLAKQFIDANNPYKTGDIFTDHIGSIKIERLGYNISRITSNLCSRYYGVILNKDGRPNKKGATRWAYQCNDINKK